MCVLQVWVCVLQVCGCIINVCITMCVCITTVCVLQMCVCVLQVCVDVSSPHHTQYKGPGGSISCASVTPISSASSFTTTLSNFSFLLASFILTFLLSSLSKPRKILLGFLWSYLVWSTHGLGWPHLPCSLPNVPCCNVVKTLSFCTGNKDFLSETGIFTAKSYVLLSY